MKNFSDATAIKPTLKLEVVLRVKPVGDVKSQLQINDAVWNARINEETEFKHEIGITDSLYIQIQIQRQHPEALEISLEVDGYKVLPIYQDCVGVKCYLNHNTPWTVNIPNFYSFYHEITGQGWII